jgi:hypothetical protein
MTCAEMVYKLHVVDMCSSKSMYGVREDTAIAGDCRKGSYS